MANTSSFRPPVSRGYSAPILQSHNSSSTTSSGTPSSPSSAVNSYFSSQAPSTTISPAISPTSPYTSAASPASSSDYPIITATVTSRNPGGATSMMNSMSAHDEALQQFALHIPNPPMLSLGAAARQPSAQAVHSPLQPNSSRTVNTPAYDNLPSPMDRSRRMPPSCHAPQMTVSSTLYTYTLCVKLPAAIQPEMVTVCANKGDKLKVVADAWHMENESHYEWQISFPPRDIDMSAVHARFDAEKNLTIDVRRIPKLYR